MAVLHVPNHKGAVLAGGNEALSIGAEGDRLNAVALPQSAVAEQAGDVIGQAGGQTGQIPAHLTKSVGGLDKSTGLQGVVALLGEGGGLFIPFRRESYG